MSALAANNACGPSEEFLDKLLGLLKVSLASVFLDNLNSIKLTEREQTVWSS